LRLGLFSRGLMMAVLCAGATGCRHKQKIVAMPAPPPATVPLDKAPSPPLVATVPLETAPMPSAPPPKKVPKPRKKVIAPPVIAPPVEVSSAEPLPEPGTIIGSLTAGGDATPEKKQRAGELIADLEKRLAALPNNLAKMQRDGITRVRNFEREARKSLDSGDAEGAVTLATKAKLLLDDIMK